MNLQSKYSKDNFIQIYIICHVIWKKNVIHMILLWIPYIFKIYILHPPPTKENDNRTTQAFTVKALLITRPNKHLWSAKFVMSTFFCQDRKII